MEKKTELQDKIRSGHAASVRGLASLFAISFSLFTILNFLDGDIFATIVNALMAVAMIVVFFLLKKEKMTAGTHAFMFILSIYMCIWIVSGGHDGFGIFWTVIVPPFVYYIVDITVANILCGFLTVFIFVVLLTPVSDMIYPYSDVIRYRFPFLFLVMVGGSYIIKAQLTKSEKMRLELSEQILNYQHQAEKNALLEQLEEQNQQLKIAKEHLEQMNRQSILAILNAVDLKDRYTKGHSNRVAEYSREIAKRMGMNEQEQLEVYYAGLLHDVGKIGIDNAIINKKSRLTDAEYEMVKLHPTMGYQVLKNITANTGMADGAKWHHERYDGKGYPDHLAGDNIPLIARVITVADVYDSMTSNRSYRDMIPQEKARAEIENGKGTQFDPKIADIMIQMIDEDKDFSMRQLPPKQKHVLVIDDDQMNLKMTAHALEQSEEYIVHTADSAQTGLNILVEEKMDIILLDLMMPVIDGFEAYQMIRSTGDLVPIVFMTGDKEFEQIEKARSLGAEDYIVKPIKPQAMLEIIHAVLEREEQAPVARPFGNYADHSVIV